MKKLTWLITGIGLGYLFNQQLRENPKVQAAVNDMGDRAREFGDAVAEGFRERESELAKPKAASKPATKPAAKPSSSAKSKATAKPASKPRPKAAPASGE